MTQIITNNGGGGSGVGVYKYKGSVNSYEDLPSSGMKIGDVYNVVNEHTTAPVFPAGTNVAWTGTDWDALGGSIDLSEYQKKLVEGAGIDIDGDTNEISVESTVINGAAAGATAVQPGDDISDLNNDAGYITGIDSSDVTTALGYTPYDSANPSGYITSSSVKNGTLTIQKNGTNVQTFSANQSSNATANISVPTDTSDLTNNAGFITSSAVKDGTLTIQKNGSTIDTFSANSASNVSVNITVPTAVTDLSDASNYQTVGNLVTDLTNPDDTHYPSAKAVSDAITSAGGGDMLKATYDPNNIGKDAFDYDNFINTPTIPAAQIQSDWNEADNTKLDYIKNKPTIPAAQVNSDWNANSGVAQILNKPTIPTVNNPTITIQKNGTKVEDFTLNQSSGETINITVPTKVSDLSNDSGFITGITSGDVTTALGYTPYNSTNPSGYVTSSIISDTAYGSGWDADTTHAPTKNAVYDKLSAMDTTIAGKQAALSTQTAYTSKGTATKVPTITTNTLGQVTGITETSIDFPVTSVNGSTGAVTVSEFSPSGTATTGYVVTKTAGGYEWAAPTGFSPSSAGSTGQQLNKTAGGYDWAYGVSSGDSANYTIKVSSSAPASGTANTVITFVTA